MKNFLKTLAIAAVAISLTSAAAQAEWPKKPIKLIIQFSAGGGGDQTLLPLKPLLEKRLGTPLLYTYKPGAGSRIGTEAIFAAGGEGYVVGGLFLPHFVNTTLFAKPKYTVNDLIPVGLISNDVPIFFVKKDSPFKTMNDLIAAAKKKPGAVSLAIGSFTGEHYISVALLEQQTGVKFRAVNVKGGSKVMSNVAGGHFDVGVSRPSSILRIREQIRGIGIVAPNRSKLFPEAGTVAEQLPNVKLPELASARGLLAHAAFKKNNPAGFAKLAKAFEDAVKSAEYAKTLDRMGMELSWKGPDAAAAQIMATHEAMQQYKPLIEAAKNR
jgi:tripartite-type tricarboxylate transporter receptor subunit TctC